MANVSVTVLYGRRTCTESGWFRAEEHILVLLDALAYYTVVRITHQVTVPVDERVLKSELDILRS